jgi:hypothetical protein
MALTLKLRVLDCSDISESGNGIVCNLEIHDAEIGLDDQNGEGSGELRPKGISCCLNTDITQLPRDCRSKGLRRVALLVDLAAATGSGCPSRAW